MSKVIALANQKYGTGKTTTTVNLGIGLAVQGDKVLLVDADARMNLTDSLDYQEPGHLPISLATFIAYGVLFAFYRAFHANKAIALKDTMMMFAFFNRFCWANTLAYSTVITLIWVNIHGMSCF
jgi:hypothetical protein